MRLPRAPRPPAPRAAGEVLAAARGVEVLLGGRVVLDDAHLVVRAGEVVALVGPNGAGKSTLLAALAGDLAPHRGAVELDGAPLGSWAPTEVAQRRAVLPQHVTVTFPFTAEEVVAMGRAPWARAAEAALDEAEVATALALADVAHLATRHVPTLSGGERARVALARVLAQRTQLLLLDEPTASLDVHHQELVLDVVRARVAEGAGAVVVLHDLGLAAAHAHRVAVLEGGRVVADGPPAEVLTASLLSRVYQHDIEVVAHPRTGAPLVLPHRPVPAPAPPPSAAAVPTPAAPLARV